MKGQRALAIAPLAVLVALLGHAAGFAADHGLGGSHAGELLALGIGGTGLLALAALLWSALLGGTERETDLTLWRGLAPRGPFAAAAMLGVSGFGVFAAGELLEGRSPFGTWLTALSLAAAAVAVAWAARAVIRWIARGGANLQALSTERPLLAPSLAVQRCATAPLLPRGIAARGSRRGRAPPHLL